jgi:hypothetical protein
MIMNQEGARTGARGYTDGQALDSLAENTY